MNKASVLVPPTICLILCPWVKLSVYVFAGAVPKLGKQAKNLLSLASATYNNNNLNIT